MLAVGGIRIRIKVTQNVQAGLVNRRSPLQIERNLAFSGTECIVAK